jgi:hypothetical protein
LTDKQWDELLESFEVMKYDADEDEQSKKLGKDIHSSSAFEWTADFADIISSVGR